jgi:peptidoglycan/xylan/chitin deacetylase (PgdA/CDA1 family)
VGTAEPDVICSLAGDDRLIGFDGDDILKGGEGNDKLVGGAGNDTLSGEAGNDVLIGGLGDDSLAGGSGADTVSFATSAAPVSVRLSGTAAGEGADVLSGLEDANGSRWNDELVGTRGPNRLSGGRGSEVVRGGAGSDVLRGGRGADLLSGGGGSDRLAGGKGRDRLKGGDGADTLVDAMGRDRFSAGEGRDGLRARDGHPYDLLNGGADLDLCIDDAGDWPIRCRHPIVASHDRKAPILMYHVIGDPPPGTAFTDLWVSASTLAAQMRWLHRHGYHVVTLQEVYDYWHGRPLPRKPIVVSFDDGFHSDYTKALPILAKHGWAGTLNLALSHLSRANAFTPWMVRRMLAAGWELDSHTRTHAYLPGLDAAELRDEVAGSRRILRSTFHVQVNFFCYPSGAYNATVIRAVRAAGYSGATTTKYGLASRSEPYTMDRIRISRGDGVAGLALKLRGT